MILYFDKKGVLRETIDTLPFRDGNEAVNKIYAYFENSSITNATLKVDTNSIERYNDSTQNIQLVDREEQNNNEINIGTNTLKYFKTYKTYKFYVWVLTSNELISGLRTATIRGLYNTNIYAQGNLVYKVENNVLQEDESIGRNEYDYIISLVGTGVSFEDLENEIEARENADNLEAQTRASADANLLNKSIKQIDTNLLNGVYTVQLTTEGGTHLSDNVDLKDFTYSKNDLYTKNQLASNEQYGYVKIGSGLIVNKGVISGPVIGEDGDDIVFYDDAFSGSGLTLQKASTTQYGIVKIGNNINVSDGVISVDTSNVIKINDPLGGSESKALSIKVDNDLYKLSDCESVDSNTFKIDNITYNTQNVSGGYCVEVVSGVVDIKGFTSANIGQVLCKNANDTISWVDRQFNETSTELSTIKDIVSNLITKAFMILNITQINDISEVLLEDTYYYLTTDGKIYTISGGVVSEYTDYYLVHSFPSPDDYSNGDKVLYVDTSIVNFYQCEETTSTHSLRGKADYFSVDGTTIRWKNGANRILEVIDKGFVIKGSVNSVSDLPASAQSGWTYNVLSENTLYSYIDNSWQDIGILGINTDNFVNTNSNQTIGGTKTFANNVVLQNSGAVVSGSTNAVSGGVVYNALPKYGIIDYSSFNIWTSNEAELLSAKKITYGDNYSKWVWEIKILDNLQALGQIYLDWSNSPLFDFEMPKSVIISGSDNITNFVSMSHNTTTQDGVLYISAKNNILVNETFIMEFEVWEQ